MEINFESVSFIVSIVSIVLAVISLLFSILFYRWSEKSNRRTFELSKGIEGNTKKIEDLFDRFYSDTFGLMKSNYEAMQSSFFDKNISTGDSSLTKEEQIETIISSMLSKSKVLTSDSIYHFIDELYPNENIRHSQIRKSIKKMEDSGRIYINDDLVSIAPGKPSDSQTDQGEG